MTKLPQIVFTVSLMCSVDAKANHNILPLPEQLNTIINSNIAINNPTPIIYIRQDYVTKKVRPLHEIKAMLQNNGFKLSRIVINKSLIALQCAIKHKVKHNNILSIIDFSLPSSKKRLWIFDLFQNKLLFHTYVSHGIKSGTLFSNYFSNKINSKASSMGIYNTEKAYYGRHGLSLKLYGLDKNFNHNAYNRFIVMHGSWYANEKFIKKYGRPGRSWGCPTVPLYLTKPIINTIKDRSLMVAYYPGSNWFQKSKFLNCDITKETPENLAINLKALIKENEQRDNIFFADKNNNNKREENDPIVTMPADTYQRIFNTEAPLKRMLRRQINKIEYIALNNQELLRMDTNNNKALDHQDKEGLNAIDFVIPVVTKRRGYYATEMKIITLGKIKEVKLNTSTSTTNKKIENYTIHFEGKRAINLRATKRFIRWLGL